MNDQSTATDLDEAAADAPDSPDTRSLRLARSLLMGLFRDFHQSVAVRLWHGEIFRVGRIAQGHASPEFNLIFRDAAVVCSLVLDRDPLRIADAYFRGDVDIEGDFRRALALRNHLQEIRLSWRDRLWAIFAAIHLKALGDAESRSATSPGPRRATLVKRHSKAENRDAVQFHYDLSDDFYSLWLDPDLIYSCAYFETPEIDLESAQQAKLEHVCRKLLLSPGERFLDVGCGWGALVIYAARHFGVRAHGITLSRRQLALAQARIGAAGLEERVTVELCDYRDLDGAGEYDKVASIGMFEHVGLKNLPAYFAAINRLLKPSGLFLNHGITHDTAGWQPSVSTAFINRYVFPDGQLDTIGNILAVMETARWEIADVESLRAHYALTLRHWVDRLERHHDDARQFVNEATYRVWRLYMTASSLEFESGELGVYQVLGVKRSDAASGLPLTRRHLYDAAGPHTTLQTDVPRHLQHP